MYMIPEYAVWEAMVQRCTNPKSASFKNYGGRGISICERWRTFQNFIADIGVRPGPSLTLDRIDNNGNYEPSNCRWVTRSVQQNNRRVCCYITFQGHTESAKKWSKLIPGISYNTIRRRLKEGWSPEQILTTPAARRGMGARKQG